MSEQNRGTNFEMLRVVINLAGFGLAVGVVVLIVATILYG